MPSHFHCAVVVLLALGFVSACGRPPAESAANAGDAQKLPFDREPRTTGISPSQSLIPSTTKLQEGTPIPVRLQGALSSASAHAGDTFKATIDEPVVIDGQTLVASGTSATGRVLEAKASANSPGHASGHSLEPGYLRIVLVSLNVDGREIAIETSSIFAKSGAREERNAATGTSSEAGQKDIVLAADRRLSFRLAQTVDLR